MNSLNHLSFVEQSTITGGICNGVSNRGLLMESDEGGWEKKIKEERGGNKLVAK